MSEHEHEQPIPEQPKRTRRPRTSLIVEHVYEPDRAAMLAVIAYALGVPVPPSLAPTPPADETAETDTPGKTEGKQQ